MSTRNEITLFVDDTLHACTTGLLTTKRRPPNCNLPVGSTRRVCGHEGPRNGPPRTENIAIESRRPRALPWRSKFACTAAVRVNQRIECRIFDYNYEREHEDAVHPILSRSKAG